MGSNNEKFSVDSFPFIENKANCLSITFFAEIMKRSKQENWITAMKIDKIDDIIDEDCWKSMTIDTNNFLVINFNRFWIIIDELIPVLITLIHID